MTRRGYHRLMDDLRVAREAARAGGAILAKHFGDPVDATYKGKFDPVTAIDHASQAAILAVLAEHRPDDAAMAEESSPEENTATLGNARHWIVDPLDGTVNFVRGIPQISVSIALYDGDEGLVGVVYDPLRDEMFTAALNEGARLNGHVISVSGAADLERSVVATGFPYDHDVKADALAVVVREVLRRVSGIRRFGSAALDLAWVAAGRFDGYWEFGIAPWDGAAGLILVREAGGIVTDPVGRDSTPSMGLVVAGNRDIQPDLRTIIESWMDFGLIET